MIAVSSFRPFGQDEESDSNALKAKQSWDEVFDSIYYLNAQEPELENDKTWFVGNDDYPTIKQLCNWCAAQTDWACIVNSDIVVSAAINQVLERAKKVFAWAVVSYRWQPKNGSYAVTDNGLDFFAAIPTLWKRAYDQVPEQLRIGHQTWDTWMIGFFNKNARYHFYNITSYRCIFHPIHGGRRFVHDVGGALQGTHGFYGMPRRLE